MRLIQLLERAIVDSAHSRYESHGRTFYVSHRLDQQFVQCGCYIAANHPSEPLRQKIAVTSCEMADQPSDPQRNSVRVFSAKSYVDPQWRRYGILSAMYDHLERFGFTVYPADGSVGTKALQAQSDDAKAFWARRTSTRAPVKLVTVSEAERHGWGEYNIFAHADHIGSMPVLYERKLHGYSNPMLVLWEKTYAKGKQSIGVMYLNERGYQVAVHAEHPAVGSIEGTVRVRDGEIWYPNRMWDRVIAAGTATMIRKISALIDSL